MVFASSNRLIHSMTHRLFLKHCEPLAQRFGCEPTAILSTAAVGERLVTERLARITAI
jgi:hypothetical protein